MSLGRIESNSEIIKIDNEENSDKKDILKNIPKGKTLSIPGRIFKYVIPGTTACMLLSVITGGTSNLVIGFLAMFGFGRRMRESFDELGFSASIKKSWNESSTQTKLIIVTAAIILVVGTVFQIIRLLTLPGSELAVHIFIPAFLGIYPGFVFSSQLSNPPFLDLSVDPRMVGLI